MNYTFRLIVGSDADLEQLSECFYEKFDGLVAETQGQLLVQINVSTDASAHDALRQIVDDVERALPVRVLEVDTDLVDIPEIAERIGRTRQSVQQLVTGARGPGGFPAPMGTPGGIRIWDWESVAMWLLEARVPNVHDVGASRLDVARVNSWLVSRREAMVARLDRFLADVEALVSVAPELASHDVDRAIASLGSLWRALLNQPIAEGDPRSTGRDERLTPVALKGTAGVVARAGSAVSPVPVRGRLVRRAAVTPELDARTVARLVGAA
jgi:hypothetical protein